MLAEAASAAGAARRGQRSAGSGPARATGLRSRHRVAPRHHADQHRSDAVRRLRAAAGLHHVHAVESVSRGAGTAAWLPDEIRSICATFTSAPAATTTAGSAGLVSGGTSATGFRADRSNSGANAATSILTGATSGATASSTAFNGRSAASAAFPNGGQVPLGAFSHVELTARADHGQPSGPVSGGDALLQSGAGRIAGRGGGRGEQGQGRARTAGEHSGRVSGNGRGVPGFAGE